jgi:hypothetical protein
MRSGCCLSSMTVGCPTLFAPPAAGCLSTARCANADSLGPAGFYRTSACPIVRSRVRSRRFLGCQARVRQDHHRRRQNRGGG